MFVKKTNMDYVIEFLSSLIGLPIRAVFMGWIWYDLRPIFEGPDITFINWILILVGVSILLSPIKTFQNYKILE